jgi:hypothetical protein
MKTKKMDMPLCGEGHHSVDDKHNDKLIKSWRAEDMVKLLVDT